MVRVRDLPVTAAFGGGLLAPLPLLVNLGYATALVVLAVLPSLPGGGGGVPDHWAHGIGYGVQAGLTYWLVFPIVSRNGAAIIAWLVASTLGCATELLQMAVVARSAEIGDLVADMIGAAIVVGLVVLGRFVFSALRGAVVLKGGVFRGID